jgi:hypothetical protein
MSPFDINAAIFGMMDWFLLIKCMKTTGWIVLFRCPRSGRSKNEIKRI